MTNATPAPATYTVAQLRALKNIKWKSIDYAVGVLDCLGRSDLASALKDSDERLRILNQRYKDLLAAAPLQEPGPDVDILAVGMPVRTPEITAAELSIEKVSGQRFAAENAVDELIQDGESQLFATGAWNPDEDVIA